MFPLFGEACLGVRWCTCEDSGFGMGMVNLFDMTRNLMWV
jgi:hypothetical protein